MFSVLKDVETESDVQDETVTCDCCEITSMANGKYGNDRGYLLADDGHQVC